MTDFSRLSANWYEWANRGHMGGVRVSVECFDCAIMFASDDEAFHLRQDGDWWALDTINDRGRRFNDAAKFSSFELAEKYLIWNWATAVRSELASGSLGAELYANGYANGIAVSQISEGLVQVCSGDDCAVLSVVNATIFSHLMLIGVEDIERMVRERRA
jgi:hypothetical protein